MEGHTEHSAAYEQIAALIARNDLHTADVLWNKRRDSLTGEEQQALSDLLERQSRRQKRAKARRAGSGRSALWPIRLCLWQLLAGVLALPLLLGAVFWMVSTGVLPSFWIALTAALAGFGGILARMFYRMYLWTGPNVRSRPAEVVALQRRRVIHNFPHISQSYWVYQVVLHPLDQAKGGKKTAYWEAVVPVFSEWDYNPVERGGETQVTHHTLHCGEVVPLYSNRRGGVSLTRYSRRSLARYYLKYLAGWTAAWGAALLALALRGSGP